MVKYFTSFYPQSFSQRKIFYNFDYILHTIKHLKMGKYFTENILHQNKQSIKDSKQRTITLFRTRHNNTIRTTKTGDHIISLTVNSKTELYPPKREKKNQRDLDPPKSIKSTIKF